MNFWLAQCWALGAGRSRSHDLGALPMAILEVKIPQCLANAKRLIDSRLYHFVAISVQSEVSAVRTWLKSVEKGRPPSLSKTADNHFYMAVMQRLPCFARKADASGTLQIGRQAIDLMFIAAQARNERSLSGLKPFVCFA